MTARSLISVTLQVLAGILSLFASLYGGVLLFTRGHAPSSGMFWMYCILLMLLLPVFCVSFVRPRLSAALQWLAAVAFVVANGLVHAHTCQLNSSCAGFLSLAVRSVLDPIAIIPFLIAALQTLSISIRSADLARYGAGRSI
jgi:hypothetical protein